MKWSLNWKVYCTGIMASAHSPWPLCNSLIFSGSLQIWTRSPTANWAEGVTEGVASLEVEGTALGVFTFVRTAGLNVHLWWKNNFHVQYAMSLTLTTKLHLRFRYFVHIHHSHILIFVSWYKIFLQVGSTSTRITFMFLRQHKFALFYGNSEYWYPVEIYNTDRFPLG